MTLHDSTPTTLTDLSTQFFLTEADIGKPRAQACVDRLSELNPYVAVKVHPQPVTVDHLRGFAVVVVTDTVPLDIQIKWNEACRESGVHWISADTRGLFG